MDCAWMTIKVGDQKTARDAKDHRGMKEGMITGFIDGMDPKYRKLTEDEIFSENMRRVFAIVRVPRSFIPFLYDATSVIGDVVPPSNMLDIHGNATEDWVNYQKNFRIRKKYIPLQTIADLIGDSGIISKLRNKVDKVNIIDGSMISDTHFRSAIEIPTLAQILDVNSISSGNTTIGTGKSYTLWSDFIADLANLTGALTAEQQTDTTETTGSFLTETHGGGYTLTLTSDTHHNGILTGGRVITSNIAGAHFIRDGMEGNGDTYIKRLNYKQAGSNTSYSFYECDSIVASFYNHIIDIIIQGQDLLGHGIQIFDTEALNEISNVLMLDCNYGIWLRSTSASYTSNIIENCTAVDSNNYGFKFESTMTGLIRNSAAIGSGTTDFDTLGAARGYNNGAEDGSAANVNWSVAADNFSIATTDFYDRYKIDDTSACHDAGTTVTNVDHSAYINSGVSIVAGAEDSGAWGATAASSDICVLRRRREGY
jgi:hypothetical protein